MGTLVKKEIYTTTRPDGTLVRTVTTTKTVAEDPIGYRESVADPKYCSTASGIVRVLEILVGFIICACLVATPLVASPHSYGSVLSANLFFLTQTCTCVSITFALLLVFLLGLHWGLLEVLPWRWIDFVYCLLACLLHLTAGCLAVFHSTGKWDCPTEYSCWAGYAAASAFLFLNCLLYLISCILAYRNKLEKRFYPDGRNVVDRSDMAETPL